jgi:hypothetical protein
MAKGKDVEVGRYSKNESSDIVLHVNEDAQTVDFREWMDSDSYTGPTKKGLRVSVDDLPKFVELVTQAQSALAGDLQPEDEEVWPGQAEYEEKREAGKKVPDIEVVDTDDNFEIHVKNASKTAKRILKATKAEYDGARGVKRGEVFVIVRPK